MENVVSEDGTIYIKMAFKNLCRLCLTEADLEPLNEPRFCENFNISLFFERELGRQLPESVCGECLMQMNQIDSFIKKWKEAQEVISQIEAQCEKMRAIYNVQIVDAKCDDTTDCSKEEVFEFSVEDAVTDTEGSGISALCEPTLNEEIIIQEDSDEIIMSECNCTSDALCENCIPYTPMLEEEIIIEEQLENNMLTSCESVLEEDRVEDDQLLQEHLDETTAPELNCTDVKICEKCGEFVTKMKIHYQTSKDCRPKNFKCVECNTAFRSSRKLKDHEVAYHWKEGSVKLFLCDKCSQTFKYQVNLNRHLHTHEEGKRFVCEKCGKGYTTKVHLEDHMNVHTGKRPFTCSFCDRTFSSRSARSIHQSKHKTETLDKSPEPPKSRPPNVSVLCDVCNKKFANKRALKLHIRSHDENRKYTCDVCKEEFPSLLLLRSHSNTHGVNKPHPCPLCSKRFKAREYLTVHMRKHTGERPFACNLCGKAFGQRTHLTYHMLTHSGERSFLCRFCGKAFALKGNLTVHMRIHTGERPFLCHICDKGFCDSSGRKKHVVSKHGESQVQYIDQIVLSEA
jgi:uncharacterized Zn-finger protein